MYFFFFDSNSHSVRYSAVSNLHDASKLSGVVAFCIVDFLFFFVSLCIINRRRNWCARFGTPQELKYSTRWALVLVYWRQWAAIIVFTTTCTGWKYFQIVQFVTDSMTAIGCNVRCSANSAVNGDRKFRYSKKRNFIS